MLFRTHFVVALLVFLLSFKFFESPFLFGLFFLFATLFVDIDSKKSKMGHLFIFRPFQLFFRHRGITHSILFAVAFSFFIFIFNSSAAFGFFGGYLVHLLLDCVCFSGVSLFWPFSNVKFKGFIKSGSVLEDIIFVLILLLDSYIVVIRVWKILF